ncbi:MAG: ATP-binding cassette domain-containing protein [Actinobacteria bacterium]|nr:ATP-binding cassette domain-containing protein [Actinomycetota bacterium]
MTSPASAPAIVVEAVTKRFGTTQALAGVDLEVPRAHVVGLLGPNGAGKTTIVRILSTLLRADTGRATVAGFDVKTQAQQVRRTIGLTGQYAAVDENLTGFENLVMIGRLNQLTKAKAKARAGELLERLDLVHAADRTARGYSGGMRRRLDLAASLVGRPQILFLDEPTTGLDPRSRLGLWDVIRELVADGTTLLLTTQYLEEADRLADTIVVIDEGTIIARGTADELKNRVGGEQLELTPSDPAKLDAAAAALATISDGATRIDRANGRLTLPVGSDRNRLAETIRRLDEAGVDIADLSIHRPSLDDVFLALTGRSSTHEDDPDLDSPHSATHHAGQEHS